MISKNTPDWIRNSRNPPQVHKDYPAEIDSQILQRVQELSFDELNHLVETSGIRDSLGILMPPEEWSNEQYIEALSDTSEMTTPQIDFIYKSLGIPKQ